MGPGSGLYAYFEKIKQETEDNHDGSLPFFIYFAKLFHDRRFASRHGSDKARPTRKGCR